MSKILVIYYSWSHGNTKRIAESLAGALGADIEPIETVKTYGSYEQTVIVGQEEVQRGYRPKLKPLSFPVADYDIIALGTPTWWYTMAPAMRTCISENDFTGKKIILFTTHGGWPGSAVKNMEKLASPEEVIGTMMVQFDSEGGSRQITPEGKVKAWIGKVKKRLEEL